MSTQPIRIGTRGSRLALAQAETVRAAIARSLGGDDRAVLQVISTTGDRIQDRTLTEIGGKGLFTLEIETALMEGRIEAAIHSLKDMPAESPDGLVIAAIPEREDPRDAYVSLKWDSLEALPPGARLGTASLRRQAQSLAARPDLSVFALRGNVDTRLGKLETGEADAILLAMAGLKRLGLADRARALLDPIAAPPAPGQGALAIQTRTDLSEEPWVRALRCERTTLAVAAERGALTALEGSCRTAIGAYATVDGDRVRLVVEALTPRGEERFRREGESRAEKHAAAELGLELGEAIKAKAGDALFA